MFLTHLSFGQSSSYFISKLKPEVKLTIDTSKVGIVLYNENLAVVSFKGKTNHIDRMYLFEKNEMTVISRHICLNKNLFAYKPKNRKTGSKEGFILMNRNGIIVNDDFTGNMRAYSRSHLSPMINCIKADDYIIFDRPNKWNQTRLGVLNAKGKPFLKPIYKRVNVIGEFWFKVSNEKEKYGIVSMDGEKVLACKWDGVYFKDSFFVAVSNKRERRFSIGSREAGPAYRLFTAGDYYLFDLNGKPIPNSYKYIMIDDLESMARKRRLMDYFQWFYNKPE